MSQPQKTRSQNSIKVHMEDCMAEASEIEQFPFNSSVAAKFFSQTEYILGGYSEI